MNFCANANHFWRYVTIVCYSTVVMAGSRFRFCRKELSFNYVTGFLDMHLTRKTKHSLTVPCESMKTTHFAYLTHLVFFYFSAPTDTDLFRHSR